MPGAPSPEVTEEIELFRKLLTPVSEPKTRPSVTVAPTEPPKKEKDK